jgi:hypothetical protein
MIAITIDGFHYGQLCCAVTHDGTYDPWRRLLAAVVVRAVLDVTAERARTKRRPRDLVSAHEFLADRRVQTLCADHIDVPRQVWRQAAQPRAIEE